jgi:hypothetical protein
LIFGTRVGRKMGSETYSVRDRMLDIPRFLLFPFNNEMIINAPGIPFKYPIYWYYFIISVFKGK